MIVKRRLKPYSDLCGQSIDSEHDARLLPSRKWWMCTSWNWRCR